MSAGAITGRPVTLHLRDRAGEVIGSAAVALVIGVDPTAHDPGAWAITHPLGHPAGGTHTEVVFMDRTTGVLPERTVDDLVRQVAGIVYGERGWSFYYRPEQVAGSVLRYGSRLRERIEVTAVELWS